MDGTSDAEESKLIPLHYHVLIIYVFSTMINITLLNGG